MSPTTRDRAARRRAQIRRRRATALGCLAIVVAVAVVFAISAGGPRSPRADARAVQAAGTGRDHHRSGAWRAPDADAAVTLQIEENAAINRLLARQPFINAGGTERREIALTFDDGPGPYTPRVLNVLGRLHVPATFFTIGFMYQWFGDSVSRELRLGDVVGDHTETHPMMAWLSASQQLNEIVDQTEWLRKYGGPFPRLWRPPYGSYNATTLAILHREHMLMVLWTVDTDDYEQPGVNVIVHNALAGARPGAIILMHDAGGTRTQTIAALPLIVRDLRKRGYTLVTVPRLILDDPPEHIERLPGSLAGD